MFVLAHLSDPHLAPLPSRGRRTAVASAGSATSTGSASAARIHRAEVLAALVADLKAAAPDHIAVTGDLVNLSLTDEFAPARAWLDALGDPHDVTFVPGNHDSLCAAAAGLRGATLGRLHARRHRRELSRSCAGAGRWR